MSAKTKFDTKFFERYARISLIDLVDKRFSQLENEEKPDLQDKSGNIGIEVTRAIRESKNVAHALINEMVGYPVLDISEEDWIDVTKYGYSYGLNTNYVGNQEFVYWETALPMKRIIENKVCKVADGLYGHFNNYGLYIFVKEDLDNRFIDGSIDYIVKLQEHNEKRYSTLFINQIQNLFICNLENSSFEKIPIDEKKRHRFYREAIETRQEEQKI